MSADEIRQEIEQTRRSLGETVDELAAKADLKARVRAKAAEAKARARSRVAEVPGQMRQSQVVRRHWPDAVAACGLVIMAVAIWQWRKQA
jgi:hypothetical protein